MYVYGGYMSDKADYLQDIYTFDLNSHKWEIVYKSGSGPEPKARSYFSMVEIKDSILIFGGTDGVDTLNDMWIYNIQTHEWKCIETKDTPEVYVHLYSLEEGIQWLSLKIISSCLEAFKP